MKKMLTIGISNNANVQNLFLVQYEKKIFFFCQANIEFLTILCKINETAHIFGVILIDISLKNLSCYMRCKSF